MFCWFHIFSMNFVPSKEIYHRFTPNYGENESFRAWRGNVELFCWAQIMTIESYIAYLHRMSQNWKYNNNYNVAKRPIAVQRRIHALVSDNDHRVWVFIVSVLTRKHIALENIYYWGSYHSLRIMGMFLFVFFLSR